MTLVALDVNATRVRVLHGLSPREARPLALEGSEADLPLAVNLEGKRPIPGRPGLSLCRRSPHLACTSFLPSLGDRREWGSHCKVDAARALAMVLDHVASRAGKHSAAALAAPGYLTEEQRALLEKTAEQSRLRLFGTVDAALAAALAAHADQPWDGLGLVLDIDEHALSWSAIEVGGGGARLAHNEFHTPLSERAWKERIMAGVADACVRRSRRDPRDSAEAEQALYDQLEGVLLGCQEGRNPEILLRTASWTQNLILSAAELAGNCRPLVDRTLRSFHACYQGLAQFGPLLAVLVTPAAARLPGLVAGLERAITGFGIPARPESDDPGEALIEEAPLHVRVLHADAIGQAVLALASLMQRQALEPGHVEAAPLLEAQSPTAGLARLHFRGRDHLLRGSVFTLGRDPRCDLIFDSAEYPSISGQHCKIIWERQGFTLHDLSRHGTWINDRPVVQQRELHPGDWIRVGPGGPLLRFLGHAIDNRKLMPTA